jgi:hypothetical protein
MNLPNSRKGPPLMISKRLLAAVVLLLPLTAVPAQTTFAPLIFRQVSGTRPFVRATLNGKSLLLMVHANAKLFVQTTHANAAASGIGNLVKTSNYGITKDGVVSPLGKAKASLKSLMVAGREVRDVTLSVFEIPQDVAETDGMLGIDWLVGQRVTVDYDRQRLGVSQNLGDAEADDREVLARGYVAHQMTWDPVVRGFYVESRIDGIPARLGISTVAENALDIEFVERSALQQGPVIGENGGPEGATAPVSIPKRPVVITIDQQATAPTQPWVYDLYAYSSKPRPTSAHDEGYLGAEFMLANQAVIDFGTGTLFLPRSKTF